MYRKTARAFVVISCALAHCQMLRKRYTLQNEAQLLDGNLADIFIADHNAVVEVDGLFHYFSDQPDLRTGPTSFKHLLLECAGFKLISIPVNKFFKADAEQLEDRIIK